MKAYLFFLSFLMSFTGKAQWDGDCLTDLSKVDLFDSLYFENTSTGVGKILFDTTFTGNVWQVGTVQKTGFAGALSGTQALQTDTLNVYPVGNESAVIIYGDSNYTWQQNNLTSLSFWHYYDTDTLLDSCILEVTIDSGKTWLTLNETTYLQWPTANYEGSLNNYGATFYPGTLWWSGHSKGWVQEAICIVYPGIKGMTLPKSCGFRFLFKSDSVQTNKPGWMIDNIEVRGHFSTPGIAEKSSAAISLKIYPNPAGNGRYTIDYPSSFVSGTVELFNLFGQKLRTLPLARTIDISDLPKGTYRYSVFFKQTNQRFTGQLLHL